MDVEKAYGIIKALAEGTNPFTGEVLDGTHVCQAPDAVRALCQAANELERMAKRERGLQRARLTLPENTGKEWSLDEDRMLLSRFRNGLAVEDMATFHGRTPNSIRARLEKLGQVAAQSPAATRHSVPNETPPSETRN